MQMMGIVSHQAAPRVLNHVSGQHTYCLLMKSGPYFTLWSSWHVSLPAWNPTDLCHIVSSITSPPVHSAELGCVDLTTQ